jgi:hypothetical protein
MNLEQTSRRRLDIVKELEMACGDSIPQEITRLCKRAADTIRQLRKDLNDEIREGSRTARDAYSEGRMDEREEHSQW